MLVGYCFSPCVLLHTKPTHHRWPPGTAFVTVGGTEVRVWDLLRCGPGATPLMVMGNHQKTVSCCSVVPSAGPSGGGRLLTGALDGHVKV